MKDADSVPVCTGYAQTASGRGPKGPLPETASGGGTVSGGQGWDRNLLCHLPF